MPGKVKQKQFESENGISNSSVQRFRGRSMVDLEKIIGRRSECEWPGSSGPVGWIASRTFLRHCYNWKDDIHHIWRWVWYMELLSSNMYFCCSIPAEKDITYEKRIMTVSRPCIRSLVASEDILNLHVGRASSFLNTIKPFEGLYKAIDQSWKSNAVRRDPIKWIFKRRGKKSYLNLVNQNQNRI